MDADTCPRCGLPEHWQRKVRGRLVFAAIGLAFVADVEAGWLL